MLNFTVKKEVGHRMVNVTLGRESFNEATRDRAIKNQVAALNSILERT